MYQIFQVEIAWHMLGIRIIFHKMEYNVRDLFYHQLNANLEIMRQNKLDHKA